ncbi:MAG: hypothetical protein WC455_12830 [Dehalococcoidia bacterium]|jgi:hypothetical protein
MNMIKPIETHYKGYRFRSRLEARYAVALDKMQTKGIPWEYEFEGFDLGKAGYYLPDFWLPSINAFAEVKPMRLNIQEVERVKALYDMTGFPVLLLIGTPHEAGNPVVYPAEDGGFNIKNWFYFGSIAVNAAKSARFEHGEVPK